MFFLSLVYCTFCKSTIKSNSVLLCYVRVRSSCQEVFCRKSVLIDFAKFTRKHLWQSLFFNKVAGLRPATLLKTRLWHRCFPVNFAKFLKTSLLTEHLRWLPLAFQNESILYISRSSRSKQAQCLKFKWTVSSWNNSRLNIARTSSLCYVAGF